jgi:branched-chain amino acid transport system substrate-binding protein
MLACGSYDEARSDLPDDRRDEAPAALLYHGTRLMWRERTRGTTSAFVRAAAAAALAVSLSAALAACGGSVTAAKTPPPVRIGAIYNLTGEQSSLDAPSLDGARLAVDRINARGGLMGRRVELLERDGQTDEASVSRAAASLVASGVSVIVGLSDTDQVLAAAPIAARAGVPFVTSGATSPRLTRQVPDWLFLACFGDNAQAAASAEYASDGLGARTAAVVYDREMDYTRLLAKYFARSFRAQGGTVLVLQKFGRERNVAVLLDRAPRAERADVLFVAVGPAEAGPIVRRLRAAGYDQPILGGDSFDSSSLIAAASSSGGGVYYTTHAAVGMDSASPAVRRFDASFQAAYGRPPQNAFACLGYDAVDLVAAAVQQADSVKPAKIRDALQATRGFSGVTGMLSYNGDDRVPRKKVTIVYIGRGPVVVTQFFPSYVPKP